MYSFSLYMCRHSAGYLQISFRQVVLKCPLQSTQWYWTSENIPSRDRLKHHHLSLPSQSTTPMQRYPYRCELCVRWWYDMLPRPVFCVESDSEVGAVWILTCFERFHRFDVCMFYDIRWSKILAHTAWRRRHWIKWWYDMLPRPVFCVEFDFEVSVV